MLTVIFADADGQVAAAPSPAGDTGAQSVAQEQPAAAAGSAPSQPATIETPEVLRGSRNQLRDMKVRAIKERANAEPKSEEERKLERMGR